MAGEDTAQDLVCCIDEAARDVPPKPNFPTQHAEAAGVSIATSRAHLAHIFTKTDTERQSDLVRLVTNMMPGLRP